MQRAVAQPIALIIFDAFDTLVTPHGAPHLQYADEARKHRLEVNEDRIKAALSASFKRLASEHPLYGLRSGLPTADDWWMLLIEQTMLASGVPAGALHAALPSLGPALLQRFGSSKAYRLAEGVPDVLERLTQAHQTDHRNKPPRLCMSLATNSDARILTACKALGLGEYLDLDVRHDAARSATDVHASDSKIEHTARGTPPSRTAVGGATLSYDVGYEKPDARFFHAAVQRAFPLDSEEAALFDLHEKCKRTLYVGDQLGEDYWGAQQAGLQAVWLQRNQPSPLTNQQGDRITEVRAAKSMLDLVEIVRRSWY